MTTATQLLDHFIQLEESLQAFSIAFSTSVHAIWYPTEMGDLAQPDAISATIQLYTNLWHQGQQDGRLTVTHPGLVAVSAETIVLAQQVNAVKSNFQMAVNDYKANYPDDWKILYPDISRHLKIRHLFSHHNLARLHLKQTYRQLPILEQTPTKVGFSWYANGKSICRISTAQARDMLCKLNERANHIQIQLEKLKQFPDDYPLARIQTQAPVLRANLVFDTPDAPKLRKAMNVSMPILFAGDATHFPAYSLKSLQPPTQTNRQRRSDVVIEDTPFLPSIRVHKYIN